MSDREEDFVHPKVRVVEERLLESGRIGARWEEEAEEAVARLGSGAYVVQRAGESDYQGWCSFLVAWEPDDVAGWRYGTMSWSYGSCSGCDCYEGMEPEELSKSFSELITWHASKGGC